MTYVRDEGEQKGGNELPTSDEREASGHRLAVVIQRLGGLKPASNIAGVTHEQLAKWRDGKTKWSFFSVAAMCDEAKVSLDWLYRGGDSAESSPISDFALIPRLDVEAAAGSGALAFDEEPKEMLAFSNAWLRKRGINPKYAHFLTARGDSMEPTIRSGDILLVDTSIDRVEDNAIYIVRVGGLLLLKRIHVKMNKSLTLFSDNKDLYPAEDISPDEAADLYVAGRVMWFGRSI